MNFRQELFKFLFFISQTLQNNKTSIQQVWIQYDIIIKLVLLEAKWTTSFQIKILLKLKKLLIYIKISAFLFAKLKKHVYHGSYNQPLRRSLTICEKQFLKF